MSRAPNASTSTNFGQVLMVLVRCRGMTARRLKAVLAAAHRTSSRAHSPTEANGMEMSRRVQRTYPRAHRTSFHGAASDRAQTSQPGLRRFWLASGHRLGLRSVWPPAAR